MGKAKGENDNSFYQIAEIKEALISEKAILKQYTRTDNFEYHIVTKARLK